MTTPPPRPFLTADQLAARRHELVTGELRKLHRDLAELRVEMQAADALDTLDVAVARVCATVRRIPVHSRVLIVAGVSLLLIGFVKSNPKLKALGADMVVIAVLSL